MQWKRASSRVDAGTSGFLSVFKNWLFHQAPQAWERLKAGGEGDEMVGWHHQLNGHEFGQTLGDGEGQGSLACCSPWGHRESDTTERLNNSKPHFRCSRPMCGQWLPYRTVQAVGECDLSGPEKSNRNLKVLKLPICYSAG